MPRLDRENTNVLAHRVAGDSLLYECPACEYGTVPVVGLIEGDDAACIDCGRRYQLFVERVVEG
jgi:hypothetical protein